MSKYLIFGGLGFIGRNLVKFLIDQKAASKIRVVDKQIPETACLGEYFQAYFNHPSVERLQINLANAEATKRAFQGNHFDYVVNLAAETKYGQDDPVYEEHIVNIAVNIGKEAHDHQVQRFIHISTAQVYDADKKPSKENDKIKPWTKIAEFHKKAEDELLKLSLPLIILRPAVVYGPGDTIGLTPRFICGAVYSHLKEKMQFLWTNDLKINTVHVRDVAGAIVILAQKGVNGEIYNLSDKTETDQQKLADILSLLFRIEIGFVGAAKSTVAQVSMKSIVEDINEKHMKPWNDLCRAAGITNTLLSPFIDQELLYKNPLSVDGTKIEGLGFKYLHPQLNPVLVKEVVDSYIQQGLFPVPKDYPKPQVQAIPKF